MLNGAQGNPKAELFRAVGRFTLCVRAETPDPDGMAPLRDTRREQLERYIAEADQEIRIALTRVDSIRAAIADSERCGRDVSSARRVLVKLETTLGLMRDHRDGIVRLPQKSDRLAP